MAGLIESLSMAARALEAQRFGLDVAGQNIANVNTPGYRHREALFASLPGTTRDSAGNGVEIVGLRANRDERLDRRFYQEHPAEQRELALSQSLAVVEAALGAPGGSVDGALSAYFDSLSNLTADPTSAIARQQVASAGDTLAKTFNDMAGRLESSRLDADQGVRTAADQVNSLVSRIASLNSSIAKAAPGASESLHLGDDLNEALKSLSGLVQIDTIPRPDGGMDVSFGAGRPLVIGANAYAIQVVSAAPSGLASIVSQGVTVTSEITGGTMGGLLHARDTVIPGYQAKLDELAYAVATEVNTVHAAGFDLQGVTGRTFFAPLATSTGAAASIAVAAGVLADPSTIAAGSTAAAGDNDTARALANLRTAKPLASGSATFSDAWGQIVYRVGADAKTAGDQQASRAEIVRQVELLRDQVSGVSLDEEGMMMMKFQRAYEANARFFQAIDKAMDLLLETLAR